MFKQTHTVSPKKAQFVFIHYLSIYAEKV